ncbi:hypothetical protein M0R72_01030 [Candidatus Pacearchaeota archaeon]|nr:hypothetical protein [Candidatus Pacearchaeota archaeon]
MITSVKELHTTIERADYQFYNYLICKVRTGGSIRYDLYRVWLSNRSDRTLLKRLGCALPLGHCRRLIREQEPNGTVVVSHRASPQRISR